MTERDFYFWMIVWCWDRELDYWWRQYNECKEER